MNPMPRRRTVLGLGLGTLLAACGGGDEGAPDEPRLRDRYLTLPQPFRVQYHAAVAAADGGVTVIGGSRGLGTLSDAVDRFDPVTRSFTRIGTLRTGRIQHSATRLADGRILVLGGVAGLALGHIAELVDERSGAAQEAGSPRQPRVRHAAVALADGRVLVVGGVNRSSVEIWDPVTRSFRLVAAPMRHPREYATATLLADGRVLIAGGATEAAAYTPAELFDPRTETFSPVAGLGPERRHLHVAHRATDGRVFIVGGEHLDPLTGAITPLASVAVFDPARDAFTPAADLALARSAAAAVAVGHELLLFGGTTALQPASASAQAYPTAGGTARALAAMPAGRAFHTATLLSDGRVLILGGDDAGGNAVESVLIYE